MSRRERLAQRHYFSLVFDASMISRRGRRLLPRDICVHTFFLLALAHGLAVRTAEYCSVRVVQASARSSRTSSRNPPCRNSALQHEELVNKRKLARLVRLKTFARVRLPRADSHQRGDEPKLAARVARHVLTPTGQGRTH